MRKEILASHSIIYILSFRTGKLIPNTHPSPQGYKNIIYRKEVAIRKGFSVIFKNEIMVDIGVIYIGRRNIG